LLERDPGSESAHAGTDDDDFELLQNAESSAVASFVKAALPPVDYGITDQAKE
jgi:hypothetical protein